MCLRKKTKGKQRKLKNLCNFSHKLQTMGINGLSQISFISELNKKILKNVLKYSYDQKLEEIIIGNSIRIVDIRQNPYVKNGFKPIQLENLLEAHKFEYVRFRMLGNPFYKKHLNEKNFLKAKVEYQYFIITHPIARKDFENLYNLLNERKINILICYCQNNECHRFWLKELLINKKRNELGFPQDFLAQENGGE